MKRIWSGVAVLILLTSLHAFAGTTTGTVQVTATVTGNSCVLQIPPLSFGSYDPSGAQSVSPLNQTDTGTIQCTSAISATLTVNSGLNPSKFATTTRSMDDGLGDYLGYEVYSDPNHITVLNQSNPITIPLQPNTSTPFDIYGSVPPAQMVPAGTYSDTLTATVSF